MPGPSLNQFLANIRSSVLPSSSFKPYPGIVSYIPVLGNASCDLDSFVSATTFAFLLSYPRLGRAGAGDDGRKTPSSLPLYVPILNLPSVSSRDLWRLRPEFGTALRLASDRLRAAPQEVELQESEIEKELLGSLVTIEDVRLDQSSPFHDIFTVSSSTTGKSKQPVILVDHNALDIALPDVSVEVLRGRLETIGCIDHHEAEGAVPATASPCIIKPGIGSCTTLIVQYLKEQDFWAHLIQWSLSDQNAIDDADPSSLAVVQLAKLSLAAILIDTSNLTAESKVSALDREIVAFLEDVVTTSCTSNKNADGSNDIRWDKEAFYNDIAQSKADALALLTLPEILARDYKTWTDVAPTPSSPEVSSARSLKLGISSITEPIDWLLHHQASSSELDQALELWQAAQHFARKEHLDILVLMTAFSANDGDVGAKGRNRHEIKNSFRRELCIVPFTRDDDNDSTKNIDSRNESARNKTVATTSTASATVQAFERLATHELGLQPWISSSSSAKYFRKQLQNHNQGRARVYTQKEVSKSRKQVAPLLRQAMREALAV